MFFGKALGGSTDGLLQIIILMILGAIFFGIHFSLLSIILTFVIIILLLIAVTSLGLAIGSIMESPEGFGLISSFVIFPLFFLSGALFPVTKLPFWLKIIVAINPVSYAVDALTVGYFGNNKLWFIAGFCGVNCLCGYNGNCRDMGI